MKKLLLLLFTPLIFTCSDESSDSDNNSNNSSNKKLISWTMGYCEDCEYTDAEFLYDNEQLVSIIETYYSTNPEGELEDEPHTTIVEIEHYENYYVLNSAGDNPVEVPINTDGFYAGSGVEYVDGYMMYSDSSGAYEWSEGNLINIEVLDEQGEFDRSRNIEYSNIDDLTGYVSSFLVGTGCAYCPGAMWVYIVGLHGNNNNKLPLSMEYIFAEQSNQQNYTVQYSYIFDNDGYPVQVKVDYYQEGIQTANEVYTLSYTD